jgi:predicted transcriptional regulator
MTLIENKFESRELKSLLRPKSASGASYQDRLYIVKDVLIKLLKSGELNVTTLATCCGLNMNKHMTLIDQMEYNGLIRKNIEYHRRRVNSSYTITPKGIEFCRIILEPYEMLFSRKKQNAKKSKALMFLTSHR